MLRRPVCQSQITTSSAFIPESTLRLKNYRSTNTITFDAMEQGTTLFGRTAFSMDRGYDDNKMFLKLNDIKQDYPIHDITDTISTKSETNTLKIAIIQTAAPIKDKVFFCYYRLAKRIYGILSYA